MTKRKPKMVRCPYCQQSFPQGIPFRRHLRTCGMGHPDDRLTQAGWTALVLAFAVVLWLVTRQL